MLVRDILKEKKDFSEIDSQIADFLLSQEDGIRNLTVRSAASQLYVAPSSIIRFCNKLGYSGFNEFKQIYLDEFRYLSGHFTNINPNYPFKKNDYNIEIASELAALYSETVKDCQSLLNGEMIKKSVNTIKDADYIYVLSGTSNIGAVNSFKDKMLKIGKQVYVCNFYEEAFYPAYFNNKKSCFIIISYSGETPFMLRALNMIVKRKCPKIAITSYGMNSLSDQCDIVLHLSSREKLVNKIADYSTNISVSFILDLLYSCYFNLDYDKNLKNRIESNDYYEHYFEMERKLNSRHSNNPMIQDKTK